MAVNIQIPSHTLNQTIPRKCNHHQSPRFHVQKLGIKLPDMEYLGTSPNCVGTSETNMRQMGLFMTNSDALVQLSATLRVFFHQFTQQSVAKHRYTIWLVFSMAARREMTQVYHKLKMEPLRMASRNSSESTSEAMVTSHPWRPSHAF